MKFFKVRAISIFFNPEPTREFRMRYFTVMYFLENHKIIYINFMHNSTNVPNACRLPSRIQLDEKTIDALPTGVPTDYSNKSGVVIEIK